MLNFYCISVEGIDKTGKELIRKYLDILGKHKYVLMDRGIISNVAYAKLWHRPYSYELSVFKDAVEKLEQERIENELKEKKDNLVSSITKSGLITKDEIEASEELKGYVDNLDEKSLKAILADRYIASLSENNTEVSETKTEVETETASTNLDGLEDEQLDVKSIMKNYFGK